MKIQVNTIIFIIISIINITILVNCADRVQSEIDQKELLKKFGEDATAVIKGKVSWEDKDMKRTTVQVYKDESLKELYCSGIIMSPDGSYEIHVEPGQYYVLAFVDGNQNGRFDPGDGLGIFGIEDWDERNQKRKIVELSENETKTGVDIQITAMVINIDGQNQIVPVDSDYAKESVQFKIELSKMFTGISGKINCNEDEFENLLVFAYADLTWKHRIATSECDENGNFKMNLLPGKYYLLAIIDENQNNLFDEGDKFGVYGIDDLSSSYPQPILLEKNKILSNIEIPIIGIQDESGKIISLSEKSDTQKKASRNVEVSGKVIWEGQDIKNTVIFIYKDPALMKSIGYAKVSVDGKFKLKLPPGKYFLVANVDINGDGKYSAGDGIGGFGTDDITKKHPAELVVSDNGIENVEISITAKYDKNGQLVKISQNEDISLFVDSGISGKIIWDGHIIKSAWIAVSETTEFGSPVFVPVETKEDGTYLLLLKPGDYYVMAIVDTNEDDVAGIKDGVGIYGTRIPTQNPPQLISVFENRITPYINIEIGGIYINDQDIAQIDDGHRADIRKRYGKPEDIYEFNRFGKQIEEWWYWTEGLMFAFEEVGAGWKLDNREEFEPKTPEEVNNSNPLEMSENLEDTQKVSEVKKENQDQQSSVSNSSQTEQQENFNIEDEGITIESLGNLIYYTYDNLVWGVTPNGIHEPLGIGNYPTVSRDSFVLSLMDTDGNVHLINLENEQDDILLKRSEMASSPSISPDGEYLAFVRRTIDRSQIFIKHIKTGDEIPLPSTSILADTPAWSKNSQVIAFAAFGNIENPDKEGNWNIYTYDISNQRIDAISVTEADESEPAWSPIEYNVLAFSRSENNHRQVWLIEIGLDGNIVEKQLTEFGGRNPAWLNDGKSIIYENNGQLWIVDVNGQNEQPILDSNEPIFGMDPFVSKIYE